MDNKKILYSFCELLRVFEFTNRVMLTVLWALSIYHVILGFAFAVSTTYCTAGRLGIVNKARWCLYDSIRVVTDRFSL